MMQNAFFAFRTFATFTRQLMRSDPAQYYQLLGDDVIEGATESFRDASKPLWLNLGYWEHARTYPDAARALAKELGDAALLTASDTVLDVGFGFAEQDIYWVENYDVAHITGLNITAMQVERARQRVEERMLQDRIFLGMGSATQMPFSSATFTKVTALECAFHFETREQFFAESWRVLKPGGRLALADGVAAVGSPRPNLLTKLVLRHWATPLANYYDRHEYKRKLEQLGFTNVACRSISAHVFPGNLKYSELRRAGMSLQDAVIPELSPDQIDDALRRWSMLGLTDYLLVTADKPED